MAGRDDPHDDANELGDAAVNRARRDDTMGVPAAHDTTATRQDEAEDPRRVRRVPPGTAAGRAGGHLDGRDLVALNRRQPPVPAGPPPSPIAAPLVPDASAPTVPQADTLDPDRILELPSRRRAGSRAESPSEDVPQTESAPITPIRPANARAKSHPSARLHVPRPAAGEDPARYALISLREAAQPYLARLATRRSNDDAASADRAEDRDQAAETTAAAQSRGKRREETPPDPVCPLCHGAGYVRLDVPVGDKLFGQAVRCECKEREIEEREQRKLRDLSSLRPFDKKRFETFDAAVPGAAEAYQVARRYAEDPNGWLILQGGYGCGKTHLAAAIARTREDAGETVFFSIVPDLLDHLRATFAPASEITYDELFDRVRHVGLLVLDDLGSENATAWATEKLFQIINYRYNDRLPTVITTNVRLLSHLDDRIRSRLGDLGLVRWVVIESGDYRERHAGHAGRADPGGSGRQPRRSAPRGGGPAGGSRGGGYGR